MLYYDNTLYYDYQKDFPSGNGWGNNHEYNGEIIDSPHYVFKKGKYQGKSLQQIINYCWRGIIKYIDYGLIFITKECFDNLFCERERLNSVKAANEAKLLFCRVYSINDELYANPLGCSVQGEIFEDVATNNPNYLSNLIERGYFPRYGRNQRFYAIDRSAKILGDSDGIQYILEQLNRKGITNRLTTTLESINDYFEDCNRQKEEECKRYWEEEEKRYYDNEGYWAAFEGDPEAEWNID